MESSKNFILVVDHEPSIVSLLSSELHHLSHECEIESLRSGEEAVAYLEGRSAAEANKRVALPNLILISRDLPGQDGIQTLKKIRENFRLRLTPVVLMYNTETDLAEMEAFSDEHLTWISKKDSEEVLRERLKQFKILP